MGWFQIPTEKESLLLKWLQTWENLTLFVRTFKFQLTEPYIFCWDIQTPTEKDSSVSKWFQRWQNLTSFTGTFKFQLKRTVQYRKDFIDDKTLHPLWEHSSFNWKKKQFSIEMISKMTEPCILCGDIHIPTENSVQHWNDFKDQRTLHPLWGHSNPNRKTQFISKWLQRWKTLTFFVGAFKFQLTEPYIFVGTFKFQWEKQFSIQMVSKMTEPYIVCGDIQIPTEKDSSVLKWSQRLQNFRSLEGEIQTPTKKDSLVLKWLQWWQKLTSFVGIFQFPTEEDSLVLK